MNTQNKNVLIGGLLAIVFVMAVGYAAFATQLNINGTANITSTWKVNFDSSKKTGAGVVDVTSDGSETPIGSISYADSDQTANLTANLKQPGDQVKFTLTIQNTGTLAATLTTPTMSSEDEDMECAGSTCTKGNIQFTMGSLSTTSLPAESGTATITVTASFIGSPVSTTGTETGSIKINFTANQA